MFKLKHHATKNKHVHHNSTYDASLINFDLINDLNKLYKNKLNQKKNATALQSDDLITSTLDEINGTNYFYENDLNLLKLNSMNIDMDVNNLEQTKTNTTNEFIDMMMIDNMDFTEEYIDDGDEPTALYSQMSVHSNESSLSSSSCVSSASFSHDATSNFSSHLKPVNNTNSGRIKMQNSYVLLKRRMQMTKRKHLNKSETGDQVLEHMPKDKRFRNKGQRVKHARKFYQRQRTSSTKLSIDLNDTLTKLKENSHYYFAPNETNTTINNTNNTPISNANNSDRPCVNSNEKSNLKLYKPSFKVEKLLNDSRGMKKYLIDYDCLMASSKHQNMSKVSKTFSLNNLSNLVLNSSHHVSGIDNDAGYLGVTSSFSSIQLNKLLDLNECDKSILDEIHSSFYKRNKSDTRHTPEITLENLNDCIIRKLKKIDQVNEENEDDQESDNIEDELEYDELLEKKSFSSISNKCSSGYLSDF